MFCKNCKKTILNQKLKNSVFMLCFGLLIIGCPLPLFAVEKELDNKDYPIWFSEFKHNYFTETEKVTSFAKDGKKYVLYSTDTNRYSSGTITNIIRTYTFDAKGNFIQWKYDEPGKKSGTIDFDSQGRMSKWELPDKISEFFYSQNDAVVIEKVIDKNTGESGFFIAGMFRTAMYAALYNKQPISEFELDCALNKVSEIKRFLKSASYDEKVCACKFAIAGGSFESLKILLDSFSNSEINKFINTAYKYNEILNRPNIKIYSNAIVDKVDFVFKHSQKRIYKERPIHPLDIPYFLYDFDWTTRTPLMWASALNSPKIVNLLIANGADIDERTDENVNSLMFAAAYNACDVVKLLMAKGVDINAECGYGQTPLMFAASQDACDAAKLLVKAGANVNAEDSLSYTPLIHAVIENSCDTAEFLIKNGAEVETTLMMIVASEDTYYDTAKLLITSGVDVNTRYYDDTTPLMYVDFDSYNVAGLLIKNGADVNAKDCNGKTPLMYALDKYAYDVAELLIKKGANVNARDNSGNTTMSYATNEDMKTLMKKYGAK